MITVTLPDGTSRQVAAGTPAAAIAADISPRLAQAALAAVVDDQLVDLTYPLTQDARVRIVTDKSPEALALCRHSTAHLMAAAVTGMTHYASASQINVQPRALSVSVVADRPDVPDVLRVVASEDTWNARSAASTSELVPRPSR